MNTNERNFKDSWHALIPVTVISIAVAVVITTIWLGPNLFSTSRTRVLGWLFVSTAFLGALGLPAIISLTEYRGRSKRRTSDPQDSLSAAESEKNNTVLTIPEESGDRAGVDSLHPPSPTTPNVWRAASPFICTCIGTLLVFGILILNQFPWQIQSGNEYSLGLLLLIGIVTVTGILGQTQVSQQEDPRSHNPEKGWNEVLGRYQLTFSNYYFAEAVAIDGSNVLDDERLVRLFFVVFIAVTGLFWGLGNYKFVIDQNANIGRYHPCQPGRDGLCNQNLPWAIRWKVVRANASLALISLAAAIVYGLSPLAAARGS